MEAVSLQDRIGDAQPPQLVTVEEGCRMLGLGRTAFYGLLLSGELASITIGRSRRIDIEDIRAFIVRRKHPDAA
jgi:excisionase family DNA binding protein